MKRFGVYFLLCAFGFWVSPGVTAAFCAELAASLKGHAHEHSEGAAGGEAHSHAAPVDADACCLQIFVGGTDAVTLTASSPLAKPDLLGKAAVSDSPPMPFLPGLPYSSQSLPAHLKVPTDGLQGPLYALFSTYLI